MSISWYSGCDTSATDIGGETLFVGLKFDFDGSTHYGWLRLSSHDIGYHDCGNGPGVPITVFEYAYNTISDASIACQPGTIGKNFIY